MNILGKDYLLVTLDFETYYAPGYTLTAMNTFTYVADPRFSIHGVGIKIEDQPSQWFRDPRQALDAIDAEAERRGLPVALLCHNTYFDGWINHKHFDWHPDLYLDTMGMSRGMFPTERASLDQLCERLWPNDPTMRKGKELVQFRGILTETLWADQNLEATMIKYCIGDNKRDPGDVGLTYAAFVRMLPHYPDEELELIDLTLKFMCEPMLTIDTQLVAQTRDAAVLERDRLIKESGLSMTRLSSNAQFVRWMEEHNIPVPLKPSPTVKIKDEHGNNTDEPALIPALGKADLGFQELRRDYPEYEHVWQGRMAAKSTGEITRAERFLETAEQCDGLMPVALTYYGAKTGRYGGAEKLNLQNLGRGSQLRRALCVPSWEVKE